MHIKWNTHGGYDAYLDEDVVSLGIATENDKGTIFHPNHMNPKMTFRLTGEIFGCKDIIPGKEILIVPFSSSDKDTFKYFEYILVWDDAQSNIGKSMQPMFCSADDPQGDIYELSSELYSRILNLEFDTEITHDIKTALIGYLKGARK